MTFNPANSDPLDEDQLAWLDEILLEYGNDDSILGVSELDGFLTAIVSGPEMIMPSIWFPEIWGGAGNEPEWQSEQDMQTFMSLLFQHMNNNATMLMKYPEEFEALFLEREVDGRRYSIVDEWCMGYMRAVHLSSDAWATAPEELLTEMLSTINLFADELLYEQLQSLNQQETEALQQRIEPAARTLHAYWLSQREADPSSVPVIRAEPKTGRNDPCPCGSGKKYKKCCLH